MEQLKSTSAVNQFERNSEICILTDRQVSCHDENIDITRHQLQDQPRDQHVQSDLVDLQSYKVLRYFNTYFCKVLRYFNTYFLLNRAENASRLDMFYH